MSYHHRRAGCVFGFADLSDGVWNLAVQMIGFETLQREAGRGARRALSGVGAEVPFRKAPWAPRRRVPIARQIQRHRLRPCRPGFQSD